MRIFYVLSAYISHRQAGLEYINCLKMLGHEVECNFPELLPGDTGPVDTSLADSALAFTRRPELVRRLRDADLVILHDDPYCCDELYKALPFLQDKLVVGYLPWENETVPEAFMGYLGRVKHIWTCSSFCREAFARHFTKVDVLPHVVRRPSPGKEGLAWAKNFLQKSGADGACVFFSVVDGLNPRKNLPALLTAFSLLQKETPVKVRLLIKQYRAAMPLAQDGVINLTDMLDNGRMSALYALTGAYVSAHHAEGWGLGLSTAMAFGKPAIAPAYSGNLEFMHEGNSLLLPYRMEDVSEEMTKRIPLFTKEMRWAEVDMPALVRSMRQVAEGRVPPGLTTEAARITNRFGPRQVADILKELLKKVQEEPA